MTWWAALGLVLFGAAAGAGLARAWVRRRAETTAAALEALANGRRLNPAALDPGGPLTPVGDALARLGRRLQAERDEQLSARRALEGVLASLPDGVLLLDRENRIRYLNPAAERLLDARPGEARGRYAIEYLRSAELADGLREVARTRRPATFVFPSLLPPEAWLEARVMPAANGGLLLAVRDVSEERRLRQMRTDFVANVSHELGTPLASIRGFSETLLGGALEDPEKARRFVSLIAREAERLSMLAADLLALSRLEAGQFELHRTAVAPGALAWEAVRAWGPRFEEAGVTLSVEVPDGLPPVLADEARIVQVFYNLLQNALKFTPRGGRVTVAAEPKSRAVLFRVTDTGVGIPEDQLGRIFERFYRGDPARARDPAGGGTGLGLAIVKHLVEAHGGEVGAMSRPGQGTTISFTLPRAPALTEP